MKKLYKIAVACYNNRQEADLFICTVESSHTDWCDHFYDTAYSMALNAGYKGPFVCFSPKEQENLVASVTELGCKIPFTLKDGHPSHDSGSFLKGSLSFVEDFISIHLDGHSDSNSEDDAGVVAFLEYYDNEANLHVFGDINSEQPTATAHFKGARNNQRQEE